MARTKEQLRKIVEKWERRTNLDHIGLGVVCLVFDARGPVTRPVSIWLHGVDEGTAARLMRENADLLERVHKDSTPLVVPPGPLIVPPRG